MKRYIFLTIVLIISVIALVSAQSAPYTLAPDAGISPFVLKNVSYKTLNSFSETNEGWDAADGSFDVTLSEQISTPPYIPLTDDGCLIARITAPQANKKYYITKSFDTPYDLSAAKHIIISANCSEINGGNVTVTLELHSEKDVFTVTESLTPASWSCITADISGWADRSDVYKINIAFSLDRVPSAATAFEYYVDSIMLSDKTNAASCIAYSADGYTSSGNNVNVTPAGMAVTSKDATSLNAITITSSGFIFRDMAEANSLKVDFKTNGTCNTVKLFVQSADGKFTEKAAVPTANSTGNTTVYLPLSGKVPREIRITFEGARLSEAVIYSITPFSMYTDTETGIVDTCAVTPTSDEILIKGKFDRSKYTDLGDGYVYLFANEFCDKITDKTLSNYAPVEKHRITSDEFIFRHKYRGVSDSREGLFKKYTVALKNDSGYVMLDTPKYVTNPEAIVPESDQSTFKGSGKGVYGESISFMQEMGVSDTVITVDMGKFFASETATGNKYELGGNVFYYNTSYIDSIDTAIKNYSEKNINVTLEFVISHTGKDSLNKVLIHKDADINAEYCAFNTSDRQGLMYFRAFCTFFAERYCADSSVNRFVLGNAVSDSSQYYNMGKKTLEAFTEQYSSALRTLYNTARSYSSSAEVYVGISPLWNKGTPFDLYTQYDAKAFLDSLNACITSGGNVDWGVSINPYPKNTIDYSSYNDSSLGSSFFSSRVGFRNLDVLTSYLETRKLLYNSAIRNVIIIENAAFSEFTDEMITADYVYNCYKALNSPVVAYITNRSCNYNNAMKYVDTTLSLTACGFATDVLGLAAWENIIDGFSAKNIERIKITTDDIRLTKPEIKGSIVFSDFASGTDGWKRYGFTEKTTAGSAFSGKTELLSIHLGNFSEGESRGLVKVFDTPYDLRDTPVLHFGINVASLPSNSTYANLKIIFTSNNEVFELEGKIDEAVWTDVYCDLSKFRGISSIDSIKILFYADENYYDSPQALITSIRAYSTKYDDSQLEQLLNPVAPEAELVRSLRKYLYPILSVTLIGASLLLLYRRTAKKPKKG